jgi:hypothetical protein
MVLVQSYESSFRNQRLGLVTVAWVAAFTFLFAIPYHAQFTRRKVTHQLRWPTAEPSTGTIGPCGTPFN